MSAAASAGRRRHRVTVQGPATEGADSDGNAVQTWTDLQPPTLMVSIEAPTASELERFSHGTIVAGRTLMVSCLFHPGITTKSRLLFGTRILSVAGVDVSEQVPRQLTLVCTEEVEPVST